MTRLDKYPLSLDDRMVKISIEWSRHAGCTDEEAYEDAWLMVEYLRNQNIFLKIDDSVELVDVVEHERNQLRIEVDILDSVRLELGIQHDDDAESAVVEMMTNASTMKLEIVKLRAKISGAGLSYDAEACDSGEKQ